MIPFYCQKTYPKQNQTKTPTHNPLSPIKTRLPGKQRNTKEKLQKGNSNEKEAKK